MKTIRTILLFSLLFLLAGCMTPEPVVKTEYVFRSIPDALLVPCEGTPPPDQIEYMAADQDKREEMWVTTYRRQEVKRKLCNNDKTQLRVWNEQQKALYQKNKEAP